MTDYYQILNIPNSASKHKAFRSFKKRYFSTKKAEFKIDLLTGFLLIANERQKFLNILLNQQEKGKRLTPKYQRVILSEKKKAEAIINNSATAKQLEKTLKSYPFKEVVIGLVMLFSSFSDEYYFKLSFVLVFIGLIVTYQFNQVTFWALSGPALILLGVYAHIRIVANVKISKIEKIAARNLR
jgi:hypothetical protein